MIIDDKLKQGLKCCLNRRDEMSSTDCHNCPYDTDENGITLPMRECRTRMFEDIMQTLEDCQNVIELLGGEQ